jgi:hypothetical protein
MVVDHTDDDKEKTAPAQTEAGEEESPPFPEDITEKALERIRAIIKGNGVKEKDLALEKIEGQIHDFEAKSLFRIEPVVSEKRTSGREQGQACGSISDVKLRVKNEVENLAGNKDIKKSTVKHLKTLNDKGFLVENQVIKLDKHKHRYVIHESCHICRGDGKIECKHCNGKGREVCNRCHGDRFMTCTMCRGNGTTTTQQGQQQCLQCRGEGRQPCRYCNQSGQQQCKVCKSTGQLACHECNHSGWQSHVTAVQFKALNRFSYEKEKLPPATLPIIDDLGPALISEGHAQTTIVEDINRDQLLDSQSDSNEYAVGYDASLPWAEMQVTLKKMPIRSNVFGFNGEVLFATPFMEKVGAKGLRLLGEAAQNPDTIPQNLKAAGKYRFVREIIYAASQLSAAKGRAFLNKKYPFGYEEQTLKTALSRANVIIKNITKTPRKKGVAFGLVGAAIFYAIYLFGNIANTALSLTPIDGGAAIFDAAAIGLGSGATILTIKFVARKALRETIGAFLPEKARRALVTKIGSLFMYAVLANILIFLILLEIKAQAGMDISLWYEAIRQKVFPQ